MFSNRVTTQKKTFYTKNTKEQQSKHLPPNNKTNKHKHGEEQTKRGRTIKNSSTDEVTIGPAEEQTNKNGKGGETKHDLEITR